MFYQDLKALLEHYLAHGRVLYSILGKPAPLTFIMARMNLGGLPPEYLSVLHRGPSPTQGPQQLFLELGSLH